MKPFLLLLTCFTLVMTAHGEAPKKPLVYVPILPYEYLFERIGGDWIEVHAIVQEGDDCHTYSPTPRQIADISKANLIFSGGLTFEGNFFVAVGDGINSPKHINLLEGLKLLEGECDHPDHDKEGAGESKHKHEHDHDHEEIYDPHVWLSPTILLQQANRIAGILKQHTAPEAAAGIDANLAAFVSELQQLDKEITETLAPKKGKAFYVYHGAFAYFATEYGLVQKSVEIAGRRPTPKQVAGIAKQAKAEGVTAIFVQPQFDESSAASLAETIGGKVQTLDPLEKDVLANLRTIAQTIQAH